MVFSWIKSLNAIESWAILHDSERFLDGLAESSSIWQLCGWEQCGALCPACLLSLSTACYPLNHKLSWAMIIQRASHTEYLPLIIRSKKYHNYSLKLDLWPPDPYIITIAYRHSPSQLQWISVWDLTAICTADCVTCVMWFPMRHLIMWHNMSIKVTNHSKITNGLDTDLKKGILYHVMMLPNSRWN